MTVYDLINSFEKGSPFAIFYDELRMFSGNRHSTEYQRAYGNVFGYLMALRVAQRITAVDVSSILESIRADIGMD